MVNIDPAYLGRDGTRATSTASARTGARPAGSTTRRRSRPSIKTWNDFIAAVPERGQRQLLDPRLARQHRRHVLLGQRHRLDDREEGGPRRLREVPGRRVRPAHQGVRQLSVRQDRRGRVHVVDGVERRRRAGLSSASPTPAATPTTGSGASARRRPNCGWTTTASPTGAPNPDAAHAWINWLLTRRSRSRTSTTTATTAA